VLGQPLRDRQAERHAATRAEILETAWDLAREHGLTYFTLRDVAQRVGMRPPSLYSYFPSKNAIYDAMFGQAWASYVDIVDELERTLPAAPRAALKAIAHSFFDFAIADLARHQLMNQRTIPGFVPSPEAYAPAVNVLERARAQLARLGVTDPEVFDLFVALIAGLIDAQQANDPGGDRWARLVDPAADMFADYAGLAGPGEGRS
jgi:AcrR family transcriptional regulator